MLFKKSVKEAEQLDEREQAYGDLLSQLADEGPIFSDTKDEDESYDDGSNAND
jgi:hypothetical protein